MQPYTVLIQVSLFNQTEICLTVLAPHRETLKLKLKSKRIISEINSM